MYTPARLITIAEAAEKLSNERLKQFPVGTVDKIRNDATRQAYEAYTCAEYMIDHGIEEIASIGPFYAMKIEKGQKVKVRKGAEIRSMYPNRHEQVAKRDRVVTVHDFFAGHVNRFDHNKITNATVHWAGAGGYWCWCDANDVICVVE